MDAWHKSSVRRKRHHGILQDDRGQDQPIDKSRAQQTHLGEEAADAQRDAAVGQPMSPGQPAGGE
jgi:hypothetical protein